MIKNEFQLKVEIGKMQEGKTYFHFYLIRNSKEDEEGEIFALKEDDKDCDDDESKMRRKSIFEIFISS